MKKSRAADALRAIRDNPRRAPYMMSVAIGLGEVDADGLRNPVKSMVGKLYRAGYVTGWLHGAGLIRIGFRRRRIPRGSALLSITRRGTAFLRERRPKRPRGGA